MSDVHIDRLKLATPEDTQALARLVRQLSSHAPPLSESDIASIIATPSTTMFVARFDGAIVGMTSLVLSKVATGLRASVEDVVVDESQRGKGIGEALMREAIALARSRGARKIDLTSNPSRQAAHRLYQRLGFSKRETDVFRLDLSDESRI